MAVAPSARPAGAGGGEAPIPVHVVPHSHWDREWYLTFESFRAQLCRLMDAVLAAADADPDYTFMPDGQVAMVDDYLEVRPDQWERVEKLVAEGRLTLGPWYTLSDQFLVSGETTLRNLELGIARAMELGGAMPIGYCPDQFGQAAQTPQLLALVGIARAVAMRGVPDSLGAERVRWRGLDGTTVETLLLRSGYAHLGALRDPEAFAQWLDAQRRTNPGAAGRLLMCGNDHRTATLLPEHVRSHGGRFSTLQRYWDSLPPLDGDAPLHDGELRSAGRESLTSNVVSNRVDLRLATACAERELERYAEPLATIALDRRFPRERLAIAWRHLVHNAAHDSICATSADAVVDEVMVRARAAHDAAAGVTAEALERLGERMQVAGMYVWNPSPFERSAALPAMRDADVLRAQRVPPLGWARVDTGLLAEPVVEFAPPPLRVLDQPDHGDTYNEDTDPDTVDVTAQIAPAISRRHGEPFARVRLDWVNMAWDHRVRIHVTLPQPAENSVADTAFGAVERPAEPEVRWGCDRASGSPAGRFVVAGGLCVMVDRVAEFEIVDGGATLAITLLRSVSLLSAATLRTRPYAAGPTLPTWGTRLLGPQVWELAIMPWPHAGRLPWREWEQFMLPMPEFLSSGGGDLPERATPYPRLPDGANLSAVLPGAVRTFDPGPPWRIATHALWPELAPR
jgi:Glycosyl hydrolases family 38 N-terminal domain